VNKYFPEIFVYYLLSGCTTSDFGVWLTLTPEGAEGAKVAVDQKEERRKKKKGKKKKEKRKKKKILFLLLSAFC